MTCDLHEYLQACGPHRPLPGVLASMLDAIPKQCEVEAVAINGQTGEIVIRVYHDGAVMDYKFQAP